MPRAPKPPKQRKVSLWLAVQKPGIRKMEGVDILKDLCGVRSYDLDSQELAAIDDKFSRGTVADIVARLSYSSTFLDAATQAAARQGITHAYWALAQYDFVHKPKTRGTADERAPFFLGVFDWNDAEDDELMAAWARGEG